MDTKLSVIIPARNERFLQKTILDILNKASGDIEVIAVLDGYWPRPENMSLWSTPAFIEDPRVRYVHLPLPKGMRHAANLAARLAKGKYLMKCDAHCLFAQGFDEVLKKECDDNWVVIPRRKRLDAIRWGIMDVGKKPDIDYHYICFPDKFKPHDAGMHGVLWPERALERTGSEYDTDDNMSFQGSCWFMTKTHFENRLGNLNEAMYGPYSQEPTEVGLKTWLSGGRVVVNKKTWYAHLHKGPTYGRMYPLTRTEERDRIEKHNFAASHWMNNRESGMIHKMEWLIDKFWPVPTWPENWQEVWSKNNEK